MRRERWYLLGYVLVVCQFLAAAEKSEQPADQHSSLAERNSRIEAILNGHSLVRPQAEALDGLIACRIHEIFDPDKTVFTQEDLDELMKMKCHGAFCTGSVAPLDSVIERAIRRARQWREWLQARIDKPANIHARGEIPRSLTWENPARDEAELEARWDMRLRHQIIQVLLNQRREPTDENIKEIQNGYIAYLSQLLAEEEQKWAAYDETTKAMVLREARLTCADRYGRFIPKEVVEDRGSNAGLLQLPVTDGLLLTTFPDRPPIVTGMAPGSPASLSGKIHEGDRIVKYEAFGRTYDLTKPEDIAAFVDVVPEEGKPVAVEIARGEERIKVPLTFRRNVDENAVVRAISYGADGKRLRVIGIPSFISDDDKISPQERIGTTAQVARMLNAPGEFDAVVLDLRGNGGGSAYDAHKVAALFLSDKKIPLFKVINVEGGEGRSSIESVWAENPLSDVPVFILTDRNTASASEILARSLQDAGRAVIIGDRTFGKGIQQDGFSTEDGIVMTTSRVRQSLNGTPLHQVGVEPDITIPYLSSTNPSKKETQKITIPQITEENPGPEVPATTFTRVDQAALRAAAAWIEEISKKDERTAAYLDAIKSLQQVTSQPGMPLNYTAVKRERDLIAGLVKTIIVEGGTAGPTTMDRIQTTTGLSLHAAIHYLLARDKQSVPAQAVGGGR